MVSRGRLVRGSVTAAAVLLGAAPLGSCSLDASGKTSCRKDADCLGSDVCREGTCRDPRSLDAGADGSAGGRAGGSGGRAGGAIGASTGGARNDAGSGAAGASGVDAGAGGAADGTGGAGAGGVADAAGGAGTSVEAGAGGADDGGPPGCDEVIRVNAASTAVTPTGSTWAAAYPDLQTALVEAKRRVAAGCSPAELWIAEGRYTPGAAGNRPATFRIGKGVALYGGFAGTETSRAARDPARHPAVLSGDLAGNDGSSPTTLSDNALHVVTVTGADLATTLDGFRVSGGNIDTLGTFGAGILHESGSGTYRNLVVSGNASAYVGGGMMIVGDAPVVRDVYFVDNHAVQGGSALESLGSPDVLGLYALGNTGSTAVVLGGTGNPRAERLVLAGNDGGALDVASGDFTLVASAVIAGNTGSTYPALLVAAGTSVAHLTVTGNDSSGAPGVVVGLSLAKPTARIDNSILWGNTTASVSDSDRERVHSSVVPGAAGNDNLDVDPVFEHGASGTWSSAPVFDAARAQTRLVDAAASFPASVRGAFVQPKTTSGSADPRWAMIADSTATTLWVWGDVTLRAKSGDSYAVHRTTLDSTSPAIDSADDARATPTDVTGGARVDVPGKGTSVADRGAWEWR